MPPGSGRKIADKILGYRLAVILGGVLMAIGEFMILGGTEHWLLHRYGYHHRRQWLLQGQHQQHRR